MVRSGAVSSTWTSFQLRRRWWRKLAGQLQGRCRRQEACRLVDRTAAGSVLARVGHASRSSRRVVPSTWWPRNLCETRTYFLPKRSRIVSRPDKVSAHARPRVTRFDNLFTYFATSCGCSLTICWLTARSERPRSRRRLGRDARRELRACTAFRVLRPTCGLVPAFPRSPWAER